MVLKRIKKILRQLKKFKLMLEKSTIKEESNVAIKNLEDRLSKVVIKN
jgi:hypothetical protein